MNSWLQQYGPWALSILALAQFWIWLFTRRMGRGKQLEIYESGTVEIGFDANGPLLAMAGVLRSFNREIFVQAMELTLTSDRDKSKHLYRWTAFKPNFLVSLAGTRAWEMPRPFLVAPGEPSKYNVVFHDVEVFPQVKKILQNYYHSWRAVERQILDRREHNIPALDAGGHEDLIGEFKRQDACVNSYTELNHKCYWEQGSYSAALKVVTEGGFADQIRIFHFSLGKQDAKLLKTNCVTMLDEPIAALLGKPLTLCEAVQAEYANGGAIS